MYNNSNITLPGFTDFLNGSNPNVSRIFLEPWIWSLGGWFFAWIIGLIAAVLYIKYDEPTVPIAFLVLIVILWRAVLPTEFIALVGLIASYVVGFLLYKVFISKNE